jgi:16S rRNA (guanine(966)-N(2))-methyltransferase RsmD
MRITGGLARGRVITIPAGLEVRPTASKIRQALFNILGERIKGAHFLDIFAGSGLIGMEALSRGAGSLTGIEENKKMARAIEMSLRKLDFDGKIYSADFRQMLPRLAAKSFDIIFADPPYKTPFGRMVVERIDQLELLQDDGIFILEHLRDYELPASESLKNIDRFDSRQYGQTSISLYRCKDQLPSELV